MMRVFLMLVFCAPGARICDVEWSTAIYPTLDECAAVSSAWLETTQQWGWGRKRRKPTGIFCELAKSPPKPYRASAKEFQ